MKMFYLFILILICQPSCSRLTRNMVKKGEFEIRNGSLKNETWKGKILFKRTSWFQELNMLYDVLLWRVNGKSKFYSWFSKNEHSKITNCTDFFIVLTYQMDSSKISHGMFYRQMKNFNYELINVHNFYNNMKFHPDFTENSLSLYRFEGLCLRGNNERNDVVISFPGFESKILN